MNAPIPHEHTDKILVIQPIDWAFKLDVTSRPHKSIEGVKVVKMESGGFFPHLANPNEFVDHVLNHINQFREQKEQKEEA